VDRGKAGSSGWLEVNRVPVRVAVHHAGRGGGGRTTCDGVDPAVCTIGGI